jgi:hypothetical protein
VRTAKRFRLTPTSFHDHESVLCIGHAATDSQRVVEEGAAVYSARTQHWRDRVSVLNSSLDGFPTASSGCIGAVNVHDDRA